MAVGTCMDLATIRKSRWIPKYCRTRGWSGSLHFLKVVRCSCVHGHEPSRPCADYADGQPPILRIA